jgi:glycosyltransferase involved in cell wall biosynthesis
VLPVFNSGRYLAPAVESILSQTLKDLELLLIDDGSTDGSTEEIKVYAAADSRVRPMLRPHRGLVHTLNEGCAAARANLIARMDADDVAEPERLSRQVAYLEQHPEVAVSGTGIGLVDEDGRAFGSASFPTHPEGVRSLLPTINCIAHPTVIMRRAAFEAVGGYRPAFRHAEDYDLWLRMSEACELSNLPEALVWWRFHSGSVSERHAEQQVVATIGAQFAAARRRAGEADPFGSDDPITIDALVRHGGSAAAVHQMVLESFLGRSSFSHWAGRTGAGIRYLDQARSYAQTRKVRAPQRASVERALVPLYWAQGRAPEAARAFLLSLLREPVWPARFAAWYARRQWTRLASRAMRGS